MSKIYDLIESRVKEAKRAWREHDLAVEQYADNATEDCFQSLIDIGILEREYLKLLGSLAFIRMITDEAKFIIEVEMSKKLKAPPKALIDVELEDRFRLNTQILKDYEIDIDYKVLTSRPSLYRGEEIKVFLVTLKPTVPSRVIMAGE